MDVALIERLMKLMVEHGLSGVELAEGDRRIHLRRGAETVSVTAAPMPAFAAPPIAPPATSAPASGGNGNAAEADTENLLPIRSPMVGTFYAAPAKGAKPYVNVGSRVDEETDVCIIEAMKTFNVHKAEVRGTIVKILVQDAQPVDFHQTLFLVRPD